MTVLVQGFKSIWKLYIVSYWWSINVTNNVFIPTVEIMGHIENHTQCYSIKSKNIKNKQEFGHELSI